MHVLTKYWWHRSYRPFCVISRIFLDRDPGIPAEILGISYNIFLYPLSDHFSQKNCFRHSKRSKIHLAPDYCWLRTIWADFRMRIWFGLFNNHILQGEFRIVLFSYWPNLHLWLRWCLDRIHVKIGDSGNYSEDVINNRMSYRASVQSKHNRFSLSLVIFSSLSLWPEAPPGCRLCFSTRCFF